VGPAFDVLHYESRGCASDHNFVENQVPIALVWEIYGDNAGLGSASLMRALRFVKSNRFMREKLKFLSSKARMEFAYKMASELKFN